MRSAVRQVDELASPENTWVQPVMWYVLTLGSITIGNGVSGSVSTSTLGVSTSWPPETATLTGATSVRTVPRPLSGSVPGTSLHISAGGDWKIVPPVTLRAARPPSAVLCRVRLSVATANVMWLTANDVAASRVRTTSRSLKPSTWVSTCRSAPATTFAYDTVEPLIVGLGNGAGQVSDRVLGPSLIVTSGSVPPFESEYATVDAFGRIRPPAATSVPSTGTHVLS